MANEHNSDFDFARNAQAGARMAAGPCAEWEDFITLFAAGEDIAAEVHSQWIRHLAECRECAAHLARERQLLSLLSEHRSEPDATMLASYRATLDDAIDREEERGWLWRSLGFIFPASWVASLSAPAWGAAALLIVGFSSGLLLGPRIWHRANTPDEPTASEQTAAAATSSNTSPEPVTAPSQLSSLDLNAADVAGISVLPALGGALPRVQLQVREQQPFTVEGTVNDDNVKNELINIVRSGDRFCPDIRLDAIDALSSRGNDPEVRSALCHAVHKDKNAAVRLKALEALNDAEPQDIIQQTVMDALMDDQNPGVRVEAITSLRDMLSKDEIAPTDKMLSVLRDRMQNDPSTYIRLQSAAAIRDLGPRGNF